MASSTKIGMDLRERLNAKRNASNLNISPSSNHQSEKSPNAQQSSGPRPKCKVCSQPSILKCMQCDVIYCSMKCQLNDWTSHQHDSTHMRRVSESSNEARTSVQSRLQAEFLDKPKPKLNLDEQLKAINDKLKQSERARSNASSLPQLIRAISLSDAPKDLKVDQCLKKMILLRSFKRHIEMADYSDSEGYAKVEVTEMEDNGVYGTIYWVVPVDLGTFYAEYVIALDKRYEHGDTDTILPEDIVKFKSHMVMAKMNGRWTRAYILNFPSSGLVELENIDRGEKKIMSLTEDTFKLPLESEMIKLALATKVIFVNLGDVTLQKGNVVEIHVLRSNHFGESMSEIRLSSIETNEEFFDESAILPDLPPSPPSPKKQSRRLTIDLIQVKHLHVGKDIKLMFLDGSRLELGKLHVCESLDENWKFYETLSHEIKEYVKANPDAGGYKPEVQELVLVKYSEGLYYRAFCNKIFDSKGEFFLIDYGNYFEANLEDVMRFKPQFLYTSCSHHVKVELASKRPLSDIDVEESRESLMNHNTFSAEVTRTPMSQNSYKITLSDSLFVFN